MSSNDDMFPSVAFQKSIISSNLNASLMFQFLAGGYIGLSVFALLIYSRRSTSGRYIVNIVLRALFITTMGQLVLEWFSAYVSLVANPINRLDLLYEALGAGVTRAEQVVGTSLQGASQILADAVLVWRCWHILALRRYSRTALVCLYIIEIVSIITASVMGGLSLFDPVDFTFKFTREANLFQGINLVVSAITSITATTVIGAHIYSSTSLNPGARRRYKQIVEIIVQSSVLYSLSLLASAILAFVNDARSALLIPHFVTAELYTSTISLIITAFAPTLMIVRLELSKGTATENFSANMTSDRSSHVSSALIEVSGV